MEGILRESPEALAEFALGEVSRPNFIYGGLFYVPETPDTERYRHALAAVLHQFLRPKPKKKDMKEARAQFRECLTNPNYSSAHDPAYPMMSVAQWQQPYYTLRKMKETLTFERHSVGASLYVEPLQLHLRSGQLLFLYVCGTRGQSLSVESDWMIREELLSWWLRQENDPETQKYLADVQETLSIIKESSQTLYKHPSVRKIANYLFPVDLNRFADALWVSRARLFKRELSAKDLWKTFDQPETREELEDFRYVFNKKRPSISMEDFLFHLLSKALDEGFLARLRQRWIELLQSYCTSTTAYAMPNSPIKILPLAPKPDSCRQRLSFGTYHVPFKKVQVLCYFEEGFEVKVSSGRVYRKEEVVQYLIKELNRVSHHYCSQSPIEFHLFGSEHNTNKISENSFLKLEELLGEALPILRGYKTRQISYELRPKDSTDLIGGLLTFSATLQRMVSKMQEESEEAYCLLLFLNTDFDDGENRYSLWDYVRFIYEYYGMPVQTLTRRSLKQILEDRSKDAVVKNILISLLKDAKQLEVKYQRFELPTKIKETFIIIEIPSSSFLYSRRTSNEERHKHFLYELYRIRLGSETLRIGLEKKFLLMLGELGEHEKQFKEWLNNHLNKEDKRLYFLSSYSSKERESPILRYLLSREPENFLHLGYTELPTTHIQLESKQEERNRLLVLLPEQIQELFSCVEELVNLKDRTFIGFKPALPSDPEYREFHHTHLQLFEVLFSRFSLSFSERELLLLSLIALSFYESESFRTPYAKLDLKAQERNIYLNIQRGAANQGYLFSLKAVLYELLYRISWLPPREEIR
ncbi:MAG: hypothetical protein NZ580_03815 [Bacteroidia bacterium]|nr:hypothetical protein [Bacteroidia bacterium]MDW8235455.1 hypothetical protein [Bacteroidia bacterium]